MRKTILAVAVVIFGCSFALGQATDQVLYSFGPPPNAEFAGESALVFDHAGNIYGVGTGGGSQGGGAVFELSPNGDGSWSEAVLYSFCYYYSNFDCPDGAAPVGLTIGPEKV